MVIRGNVLLVNATERGRFVFGFLGWAVTVGGGEGVESCCCLGKWNLEIIVIVEGSSIQTDCSCGAHLFSCDL